MSLRRVWGKKMLHGFVFVFVFVFHSKDSKKITEKKNFSRCRKAKEKAVFFSLLSGSPRQAVFRPRNKSSQLVLKNL
jgi:hypothetical protein